MEVSIDADTSAGKSGSIPRLQSVQTLSELIVAIGEPVHYCAALQQQLRLSPSKAFAGEMLATPTTISYLTAGVIINVA